MTGLTLVLIGMVMMLQPMFARPAPDIARLVGVSRALRSAFRAQPGESDALTGLLDDIGETKP